MKEKIKTLQIIHLVICAGIIIIYIIVGEPSADLLKIPIIDSSSIIYIVSPVLAFFLSNFLFQSQLKKNDQNLNPEEKLPLYQSASIIRWAILEGTAFFILFIKPDFLLVGVLVILYLISLRPTEERIIKDL